MICILQLNLYIYVYNIYISYVFAFVHINVFFLHIYIANFPGSDFHNFLLMGSHVRNFSHGPRCRKCLVVSALLFLHHPR